MVPNSGLSKGLEKKYVALNLDSLKVAFETRLLGWEFKIVETETHTKRFGLQFILKDENSKYLLGFQQNPANVK